jgi:hypothetical protein
MKTKEVCKEIFNLAVRLLGLLMLYQGVRAFALPPNPIFTTVVFLAAACWLLCGAYPVPRWAYPEVQETERVPQELDAASRRKADA